jgi:Domain of unknown function (DUF1330)
MIRDRVMGKRRATQYAGCVGMSRLPSAVATARVPYKGASFLGLTRQSHWPAKHLTNGIRGSGINSRAEFKKVVRERCPGVVVVVEFDSAEQAMLWYNSPEYLHSCRSACAIPRAALCLTRECPNYHAAVRRGAVDRRCGHGPRGGACQLLPSSAIVRRGADSTEAEHREPQMQRRG